MDRMQTTAFLELKITKTKKRAAARRLMMRAKDYYSSNCQITVQIIYRQRD